MKKLILFFAIVLTLGRIDAWGQKSYKTTVSYNDCTRIEGYIGKRFFTDGEISVSLADGSTLTGRYVNKNQDSLQRRWNIDGQLRYPNGNIITGKFDISNRRNPQQSNKKKIITKTKRADKLNIVCYSKSYFIEKGNAGIEMDLNEWTAKVRFNDKKTTTELINLYTFGADFFYKPGVNVLSKEQIKEVGTLSFDDINPYLAHIKKATVTLPNGNIYKGPLHLDVIEENIWPIKTGSLSSGAEYRWSKDDIHTDWFQGTFVEMTFLPLQGRFKASPSWSLPISWGDRLAQEGLNPNGDFVYNDLLRVYNLIKDEEREAQRIRDEKIIQAALEEQQRREEEQRLAALAEQRQVELAAQRKQEEERKQTELAEKKKRQEEEQKRREEAERKAACISKHGEKWGPLVYKYELGLGMPKTACEDAVGYKEAYDITYYVGNIEFWSYNPNKLMLAAAKGEPAAAMLMEMAGMWEYADLFAYKTLTLQNGKLTSFTR